MLAGVSRIGGEVIFPVGVTCEAGCEQDHNAFNIGPRMGALKEDQEKMKILVPRMYGGGILGGGVMRGQGVKGSGGDGDAARERFDSSFNWTLETGHWKLVSDASGVGCGGLGGGEGGH